MSQVHQNNPVIRGTAAVIDALPASLSLPLWRGTNEQQTSMGGGRQKTESGKRERRSGDFVGAQYLNPMIGHSLQMLHLAWCLAVSAAATLCKTGSHTMDWGSRRIQSRKRAASISGLLLAWERRRRGKQNNNSRRGGKRVRSHSFIQVTNREERIARITVSQQGPLLRAFFSPPKVPLPSTRDNHPPNY